MVIMLSLKRQTTPKVIAAFRMITSDEVAEGISRPVRKLFHIISGHERLAQTFRIPGA